MVFLRDKICDFLPPELRKPVSDADFGSLREISLRVGRPVALIGDSLLFVGERGITPDAAEGVPLSSQLLGKTLERICRSSVYAVQDSLIKGFVPLPGGHRAGVCGKTVTDKGKITHLTEFSSVSIRIARQIKGAADGIMDAITLPSLKNTLIISPPGCGKTTLLRDIARQLAGVRYMYRAGIVDERGEIAACCDGEPQMDIGVLSDVYHLCPKAQGMEMLLRSMSPDVVITDEIGGEEDGRAILSLANAGIKIICSAHAYGKSDLFSRQHTRELMTQGIFERIIVLSARRGVGRVERVY